MTQVWLANQDDLMVFGFEPNPKAIDQILKGGRVCDNPQQRPNRISDLVGTRFFIIPCALTLSTTKTALFYVTANDYGCSSLYPPVSLPVAEVIRSQLYLYPIFSISSHSIRIPH